LNLKTFQFKILFSLDNPSIISASSTKRSTFFFVRTVVIVKGLSIFSSAFITTS